MTNFCRLVIASPLLPKPAVMFSGNDTELGIWGKSAERYLFIQSSILPSSFSRVFLIENGLKTRLLQVYTTRC